MTNSSGGKKNAQTNNTTTEDDDEDEDDDDGSIKKRRCTKHSCVYCKIVRSTKHISESELCNKLASAKLTLTDISH